MTLERIIEENKQKFPGLELVNIDKESIVEKIKNAKRKSNLDIAYYYYCCYGVEENCWIDTVSCWADSLKKLKETMINLIDDLDFDKLYYTKIDGTHYYLSIEFIDRGGMPDDYRSYENKYDGLTREEHYNKFARYKRVETCIYIKEK